MTEESLKKLEDWLGVQIGLTVAYEETCLLPNDLPNLFTNGGMRTAFEDTLNLIRRLKAMEKEKGLPVITP